MLSKVVAKTKRKVSYSKLSLIRTIGIVWDASNPYEFLCISRFYQKMQERKIEVKVFGYYSGKILPQQYIDIKYFTCLRRNDINFFYSPVTADSDRFISNKFDILIDINFKKLFPLQYISSLSNAGFKVGLFEPETKNSQFDLMMEIKSPVDVDHYLDQVIKYLEMINSETA